MKTRYTTYITLSFALFAIALMSLPNQAKAQSLCCKCADTIEKYMDELFLYGESFDDYPYSFTINNDPTLIKTIRHIEGEFTTHKQWIAGIVWEDNILPAMMMMTDQLVNVGMKQIEMLGTLFDAKIQLETQQAMQVEEAKIHKIYTPSMGMCEIGTSAKSLASTERRSEINRHVLSQRTKDRYLANAFTSAYASNASDSESRLRQFKQNYCSTIDNENGMGTLCSGMANPLNRNRRDRDIDYTRLMETPWTINMNFTDETLNHYEEDMFALASNLYGSSLPLTMNAESLENISMSADAVGTTDVQDAYMDLRALMAKRSVAENSFNAIAGMKSSGTSGSREYLINVLAELGVPVNESVSPNALRSNDASILLAGDDWLDPTNANPINRGKPSYYAQMEILTKKMVQNPDFYTNLYDKPTNVDRKSVALQAIGLMQKFDVFKSYLRQEAAVSVMLEMAVEDLQDEVESELGSQ